MQDLRLLQLGILTVANKEVLKQLTMSRQLWDIENMIYLRRFNEERAISLKQPSRGVLRKKCSENMQQIYRRTPMLKCDFNKVALQLY